MNSSWLDRTAFQSSAQRFPLTVSLLSWGYNEEENIEEFLERSQKFMDSLNVNYEHIVIDDASSDKTYELALKYQGKYPQLRIIKNATNMNSGWNTRIAIKAAKNEVLFWQTVDWAYDISRMKEYLWHLKNHDVVQGVRIPPAERKDLIKKVPLIGAIEVYYRSDNWMKGIISVVNYTLIRFLFRVPLLDYQNVTVYPTKLAQAIECETSTSFTNPELIMKAYWKGADILQVPIGFLPRKKGEAKGTKWRSVLASIRQIFFYWMKWNVLRTIGPKKKGTIAVNLSAPQS